MPPAGFQGIAKRSDLHDAKAEFRVAMRPGKCCGLPNTPDGRLQNLIETAQAQNRSKVERPFLLIKQQFGFQKTGLLGLVKARARSVC